MIDAAPGFRRRFRVEPAAGRVRAAVEDDYHCMAVTLHHDGSRIAAVEAVMDRAPWTTCPGAPAVLVQTFAGLPLTDAVRAGEKRANCTHLHDLAGLAAAHAHDAAALVYDILVSDAVGGVIHAEIRRDGQTVLALAHRDDVVTAPDSATGTSLFALRGWIDRLASPLQEPARLLQWGTILAHGRAIPLDRQSDASRIPPNCYTFQEVRKAAAQRIGQVLDFSQGPLEPLDHLGTEGFRRRET